MKVLGGFKMRSILVCCAVLFLACIGSPPAKSAGFPQFRYIEPKTMRGFVNELNELGKLGYKLKYAERNTQFSPPEMPITIEIAGIVELQEGSFFEYEWFESVRLEDVVEQISPKAEFGYYFCYRLSYSTWRDPYEDLPKVTAKTGTTDHDLQSIKRSVELTKRLTSQDPIDGSIFILERKDRQIKPIKFELVTATPATSIFRTNVVDHKKITDTLENAIKEVDTRNYSPVTAFYSSKAFNTRVSHLPTILFQNDLQESDDVIPIYKVAETFQFASKFREQIDLAAKKGFNIQIISKNFALLRQSNKQVRYVLLEPRKKDFLQRLQDISSKGGRFSVGEVFYTTETLVFETPLIDDGKRFEYQYISAPLGRNFKGVSSLSQFNELINEGYQPKILIYNKGMNILFERQKTVPN